MTDPKNPPPLPTKREKVRVVRAIFFATRIGRPGQFDSDLSYLAEKDCDFRPAIHQVLGPGIWATWKTNPSQPQFVPITNVTRVDYAEREEPTT